MPGRIRSTPVKFSYDETHRLMSQRKQDSLKKAKDRNRKKESRNKNKIKEKNMSADDVKIKEQQQHNVKKPTANKSCQTDPIPKSS